MLQLKRRFSGWGCDDDGGLGMMRAKRTGARAGLILLAMTLLQSEPPSATAGLFDRFNSAPTPALNYCAVERAPLVAIDRQYSDAEHSRIYKAIGAGVLTMYGGLLTQVLTRAVGSGGKTNITNQQVTFAVLAGIAASVGTYLKLKEQAGVQDRRALAIAVDTDAAQQLGAGRDTAQEAATLSACRQRQLAEFEQHATTPGAATATATPTGDKAQIIDAIRTDIALTDRVVGRQAALARTFTEARAMAEGQPESRVLGAQTAAFPLTADAQTPLLPSNSPFATQPPPVASAEAPKAALTVLRPTSVRAAPLTKATVIETVTSEQELTPWTGPAAPPKAGWTAVDANGQPGYVRSVYLTSSRSVTTASTGGLPPAQNVRAYNKVVLEARDDGPDRMRNMLTSFQ